MFHNGEEESVIVFVCLVLYYGDCKLRNDIRQLY